MGQYYRKKIWGKLGKCPNNRGDFARRLTYVVNQGILPSAVVERLAKNLKGPLVGGTINISSTKCAAAPVWLTRDCWALWRRFGGSVVTSPQSLPSTWRHWSLAWRGGSARVSRVSNCTSAESKALGVRTLRPWWGQKTRVMLRRCGS